MIDAARAGLLRLTLARACAWGLLVAGWIGIGSLALQFAPAVGNGVAVGFALVALWLLALGAAAAVSTRGGMRPWVRALALCVSCHDHWHRLAGDGSRPGIACTARGPACVGCVDRACLGSRAHAAVDAVRSARTADRRRKPRRACARACCWVTWPICLGFQCGLQHSSAQRPWCW